MDDLTRFRIVAEAASIVSRLNPDAPDDVVAEAVAMIAVKGIESGATDEEFLAGAIAMGANEGVAVFTTCDLVTRMLSLQVEGRDEVSTEIDTGTEMSSLKLDDGDVAVLRGGFSEAFGIDADRLDFASMPTVADLVEAVLGLMPEDEEPETCSHGVCGCGGNTSAYKQRQDADIARLGVTLAPVLPGDETPGFVYSLGMSEQGRTDLLFVGDFTPPTYDYLSMFLSMQMDGAELPMGLFPADHEFNGFGVPIWVVPANEKLGTHAFGAVTRLERIGSDRPARLAQVVMPDKAGRFPWDEGYDWLDQQAARPEGLAA